MAENKGFEEKIQENVVSDNAKISVEPVRDCSDKTERVFPLGAGRAAGIVGLISAIAFALLLLGVFFSFFSGILSLDYAGSDENGLGYGVALMIFLPVFLILFVPTCVLGSVWHFVTSIRTLKMASGKCEICAQSRKMSVASSIIDIITAILLGLCAAIVYLLMVEGHVTALLFVIVAIVVTVILNLTALVLEKVLNAKLAD